MARIKFSQILDKVFKYAPTQLLNAGYAKIKKMHGVRRDEDGRVYAYATTYSTKVYNKKLRRWVRKKAEYYDTFIMINPKRGNVVLSCSCPDFKYRHEVALFKRGGADIEYSNGMVPHITNPKMRATCCKHCLRFYNYLSKSKRYQDIFAYHKDLDNAIG